MQECPMKPDDPWSRVDYRRLIAWPERIEREWPFLQSALQGAPSPALLDLGCGTGEHSRFLASKGFSVIGIDASPAMLEKAGDGPRLPNLRFVQGDIADVAALVPGMQAGAAICLGNTLPHLHDRELRRFASGLSACLLPGSPFVLQILNYARIRARKLRYLPLNFRSPAPGEPGETVFLRLMDLRDDGTVVFSPTTLRYRPDHDPPVEVMSTRSVHLRAWTRSEVEEVFAAAGFSRFEAFGGFDGGEFVETESADLLAVLHR
jgi:SAM-dependent methyltransferase